MTFVVADIVVYGEYDPATRRAEKKNPRKHRETIRYESGSRSESIAFIYNIVIRRRRLQRVIPWTNGAKSRTCTYFGRRPDAAGADNNNNIILIVA